MPNRSSKRPRDFNQLAKLVTDLATGQVELPKTEEGKNEALIGNYYHLFGDYCVKIGSGGTEHTVIHSLNGLRRLS